MSDKLENAYVLLIVHRTHPTSDNQKSSNSMYTVTIPKNTPPQNRGTVALNVVREAINKWLRLTVAGKNAWESSGHTFCWRDLDNHCITDWLRSQCTMPYRPGADLTWVSDVLVETVPLHEAFNGDID